MVPPEPTTAHLEDGLVQDADVNGQGGKTHALREGQEATQSERDSDATVESSDSRYQLWHEAEELAEKNVGTKQWKLFVDAQGTLWSETAEDGEAISKRLRILQNEYKARQWTFKRDGTEIAYADVVGNIVACVDNAKGLLGAAARLDPTKAAGVVWAGVEILLSVGAPLLATMTLWVTADI